MENLQFTTGEKRYFAEIASNLGLDKAKGDIPLENKLFSLKTEEAIIKLNSEGIEPLIKGIIYFSQNYLFDETQNRNIITAPDGTFTYLPAGNMAVIEGGLYMRQGRAETKAGRLLLKLDVLKPIIESLSNNAIELFTNHYKAMQNGQGLEFTILTGRKLVKIYTQYKELYFDKKKSIGRPLTSSCMNNQKDYFSLYADNKNCKMLCLFDEDKTLHGRALLWFTNEGILFMDRIYGAEDKIIMFKNWAKENGYFYRNTQEAGNFRPVDPRGETHNITLTVNFKELKHLANFPYMDSFNFGNTNFNIISTARTYGTNLIFQSTSGGSDRTTSDTTTARDIDGAEVYNVLKSNCFYCPINGAFYLLEAGAKCSYTGCVFFKGLAVNVGKKLTFSSNPLIVKTKSGEFIEKKKSKYNPEEKTFEYIK